MKPAPGVAECYQESKLKYVKDVFCVDQLSFVKPVTNVQHAVSTLPVVSQNFWEALETLGAAPKVLQMIKQGYILPFLIRPNLTRSPTMISCYANPHRNLYLLEALHQPMNKNTVELVKNQESLGFYNLLFWFQSPTIGADLY